MPGMIAGLINAQWIELTSKVLSLARKAMVPFVIASALRNIEISDANPEIHSKVRLEIHFCPDIVKESEKCPN